MLESAAELLISSASLWEIAIKLSIGKPGLAQPYDIFIPQQLKQNGIKILPVNLAHPGLVSSLPFYHRDPFDRLIIAQAIVEQLPIVSADAAFDRYSIKRFW